MSLAVMKDTDSYSCGLNKQDVTSILEMLAFMRPAFTIYDDKFIARFIEPTGAKPDAFGNYILRVGESRILWSSHTDTVHSMQGWARPNFDAKTGRVTAHAETNCLGADCTAGVWLMLEMINAKVPGLYVFHRAEERGGVGSKYIAEHTPELLAEIDHAIAFDRYGTDSIITYQMASRSCSDAFCTDLAVRLNKHGFEFKSDDSGVYTDTAFYTDLVSECTNISVGYYNQHSKKETLDLNHLFKLRDALISVDFSDMIVNRDPSVVDNLFSDCDVDDDSWVMYRKPTLIEIVKSHPERVAWFLHTNGINSEYLWDEIKDLFN